MKRNIILIICAGAWLFAAKLVCDEVKEKGTTPYIIEMTKPDKIFEFRNGGENIVEFHYDGTLVVNLKAAARYFESLTNNIPVK